MTPGMPKAASITSMASSNSQARARIYEMPISYSGRTYAEGKKIGWKDGVAALWHILRFNLLPPRRA